MGQTCIGIIHGCISPKGVDWHGEDGERPDFTGVLGRWEKAQKGTSNDQGITTFSDGDEYMVGVLVAVGGSGRDGVAYLGEKCDRLTDFSKSDGAKEARKLWDRFSAWAAKNEKITLPAAELWLVPTETA